MRRGLLFARCVDSGVRGREAFRRDPADIELADQLEIAIVIGSPPEEIPSEFPDAAGVVQAWCRRMIGHDEANREPAQHGNPMD